MGFFMGFQPNDIEIIERLIIMELFFLYWGYLFISIESEK